MTIDPVAELRTVIQAIVSLGWDLAARDILPCWVLKISNLSMRRFANLVISETNLVSGFEPILPDSLNTSRLYSCSRIASIFLRKFLRDRPRPQL